MITLLITTSAILLVGVITLLYITRNLLKKHEVAEDIIIGYIEYLDKFSRVIEASDEKVREIDHKGTFSSDDEVGFFFKGIKDIQSILNDFNIKKLTK